CLFNGSGQALISEVKEASSILLPMKYDNNLIPKSQEFMVLGAGNKQNIKNDEQFIEE
ncbi:MAG: hypothetical protein F6K24_32720, partial [Okeania sp. SIO2D1]|nr:hypothetical protein [Okeania sp. SIO2D1]